MAKVTVSQLLEMVEELREEIETLKEQLSATPQVQLVAEVRPPKPVSKPVNWLDIWTGSVGSYQSYAEEEWGYGTYI